MAEDQELERLKLIAKAKTITFKKRQERQSTLAVAQRDTPFATAPAENTSVAQPVMEEPEYTPADPSPPGQGKWGDLLPSSAEEMLTPKGYKLNFGRMAKNAPGALAYRAKNAMSPLQNMEAMGLSVAGMPTEIFRRTVMPLLKTLPSPIATIGLSMIGIPLQAGELIADKFKYPDETGELAEWDKVPLWIGEAYAKSVIDGMKYIAENPKETIENDPFVLFDVIPTQAMANRILGGGLGAGMKLGGFHLGPKPYKNIRVMAAIAADPLKKPWDAATGYAARTATGVGDFANKAVEGTGGVLSGMDGLQYETIRLIAKNRKVLPQDITSTGGNIRDALYFDALDRPEFLAARKAQRSMRGLYEESRKIWDNFIAKEQEKYNTLFPQIKANPLVLANELDDIKLAILDDLKDFGITPKGRNIIVRGRRVKDIETGLENVPGGGKRQVSTLPPQDVSVTRTPVKTETPTTKIEVTRTPSSQSVPGKQVVSEPNAGGGTKDVTKTPENTRVSQTKVLKVAGEPIVNYESKPTVSVTGGDFEDSTILPGVRQIVEESKQLKEPRTVYIDPMSNLPLTKEEALSKNYDLATLKTQERPGQARSLPMAHLIDVGPDGDIVETQKLDAGELSLINKATKKVLAQEVATVAELDQLKRGLDTMIRQSKLADPASPSAAFAEKLRTRIWNVLAKHGKGETPEGDYINVMGSYEEMRKSAEHAAALMSLDSKNIQTAANALYDSWQSGPKHEMRRELLRQMELLDDGTENFQNKARLRARIAGMKAQELFGRGLIGRNVLLGAGGLATGAAYAYGGPSAALLTALAGVGGFAVTSPKILSHAFSALGMAQGMKNDYLNILKKIHTEAEKKGLVGLAVEGMTYNDLIERLYMSDAERQVAEAKDREQEAIEVDMNKNGIPYVAPTNEKQTEKGQ